MMILQKYVHHYFSYKCNVIKNHTFELLRLLVPNIQEVSGDDTTFLYFLNKKFHFFSVNYTYSEYLKKKILFKI